MSFVICDAPVGFNRLFFFKLQLLIRKYLYPYIWMMCVCSQTLDKEHNEHTVLDLLQDFQSVKVGK